ncbi:phage tail tape measure protein [Delftia acidovorans]|uniref:phage tail tape measure protein n=1 Tax=Delftia acidovorans TaxID=80866 RepID=UPI0018E80949|nr:phage tail tape measure protein [Delftia acidovorans]MBJ2139827.1 phage tail tape measure protein [Delftia acidovorans]
MAFKPIEIIINAKDNASAVFSNLQAKITAVGVAVLSYFGVSAFAGAVKGAADFEQAMSNVKAATDATSQEMAALTKAAQDAGLNTKYSSVEAAGALENLAKAGLNAEQAIQTLPAVLALAQAGNLDLGRSAEIVSKAVMGMGLSFEDAGRVADVLAKGANATNTSVDGLAQALSYAAPVAKSLGLSLESTVAIVGKFADAGIDASRAGTALNSILSQFSNPASAFRNELAAAGITTNDFGKALHELAATGARGEKAINSVGMEAGPALRALLNQGMGSLDELTVKLQSAEGSAAATAKTMSDNLNGSLERFGGAWKAVKDTLSIPVLGIIREGVDQLTASLRTAVQDGTVANFGKSLAVAFKNGLDAIREFLSAVDFKAVGEKLQAFAAEAGEVFATIREYATNTSNALQLAWGVMSAGVNSVLTVIYGLGSVFAEVASGIMKGVAWLREGLASVTFGKLAEDYKKAALQNANSAEFFGDAAQAMRNKAVAAFDDATKAAQMARGGFAGLAGGMEQAAERSRQADQAMASVAEQLTKTADANTAARQAIDKKARADEAARVAVQQHREALTQLRADYQQLVKAGDLDAAGAKLEQINKKLRETPGAAADAGKAAKDAAEQLNAAFSRLGVVSSQALTEQAANARRDYETIKNSGVATAEDLSGAFKKAAEDAIAANKGVAPSWVAAEAAARGVRIEVGEGGKSVVVLGKEFERAAGASGSASANIRNQWGGVRNSINEASDAAREFKQRMNDKYGRPGQNGSNGEQLGDGVQQIGSGGAQFRNKDGFTSDAKGNVQQQWVWTRAAIIEYLQQAGLDELLAEDLAKQFTNADGTVPYVANDAQKRWGGQFGTLAQALGNMADYYKYGDGKFEANQRVAFLKGTESGTTPKSAPEAERPSNNSMFGSQSVTINLQVNGQDQGRVRTDTEGEQTMQRTIRTLMSELERSKSLTGL